VHEPAFTGILIPGGQESERLGRRVRIMPGIGVIIGGAKSAAPYVATAVGAWGVVGFMVWFSLPSAPPAPPGAEQPTEDCEGCEADRRKWERMSDWEKLACVVFYIGIQALCWARGCEFSWEPIHS
jgi:hypothetical protein